MKVNIKNFEYNKNDVILSIGLIVKNEEKVLERCLRSLQPLMNLIPSELIIADTGSSDSTVEIAKKYTENVFHFEWINDFAAARNSTLEKAKGLWYLFVDADEYLDENIDELISFFTTPDVYLNTYSAFITVRSYTDENFKKYVENELPRFHRINYGDKPVRFVGSIHESIPFKYPNAKFSTILHHTGYVYSSEQQLSKKMKRNNVLMEDELRKNPEDSRLLSHIIKSSMEKTEKEKYVQMAYNLVKKKNETEYENALLLQIIDYYMDSYPNKALEVCNSLKNSENYQDDYLMDIAIRRAKCLALLYRFEDAILEYECYFEWYKEKENNKKVTLDITGMFSCLDKKIYWHCVYCYIIILKDSKNNEKLFITLDNIKYDELDDELYYTFVELILKIYHELNDLEKYVYFINKFLCFANSINKIAYINKTIENAYYSFPDVDKRNFFAKKISEFDIDNKSVNLMKLISDEENRDIKADLLDFMNKISDWRYGYSESIYLAIKNKLDISDIVEKIDNTLCSEQLICISVHNDEFAKYVLEYGVPESFYKSIKRFNWIVMLYETAVYRAYNLNTTEKCNLYYIFSKLIGDFVNNLYNPDLLNEEDIGVLSPLHRFGYYMYLANESLDSGDKASYIRNLKKGLLQHDKMNEVIEILFMRFKNYYL